uniref:Uncharacterized protein n=1 Tax=Setaria viridis TaxID=4556 RepID=A0A4U6TQ50_SETVI|nr:hypothetical protein SEVIR_8G057732v2 [Setaria viridis]
MGSSGAQQRASAAAHAACPRLARMWRVIAGCALGMKRTTDEVIVLLMSLAAAAASYNSGWGRRH